jgi:hypothetical protein
MPMSLPQVRDLLLPGLWGKKIDADIFCNFNTDSLEIATRDKRETLFTREDIENGTWKAQFGPRLKQFLGES